MHRLTKACWWACLFFLVLVGLVRAQEAIRVLDTEAEYTFSRELRFRLVAEADNPIVEVTLFYRPGWWATVSRAYPEDFKSSSEIDITVRERLQRGQIPPGTEIEYWWRLTDEAGNTLKTETYTLLYMDDRFEWQKIERGMIHFWYYDLPRDEAERLADISADALQRIAENFGVEPDRPVKIFAYNSKADMQEALISRGSTFEAQVVTLGTVVAPDTMLLLATHPEVEPTIYHELTHVVVGLATENPFADLPAWLNEGLAMYNEGELRADNRRALEEAIRRNDVFSVRSLTSPTGDPERVNLWYAQVYSLVDYLITTYGREKMHELLQVFAEGELPDRALEQVYGFDQDGLDQRWREWVGLPPRSTPKPTSEREEATKPVPQPEGQVREEPVPEPSRNPIALLCSFLPGLMLLGSFALWGIVRRPN